MTKILYLIDGLGVGGAERQFCLLLKYLPRENWSVEVLALADGPYRQVLLDQNIPVKLFQRQSRYHLRPILQVYREILRHSPQLVHSWGGLSSAIAAPVCSLLGIPLIDGSIRIAAGYGRHAFRRKLTFALAKHIVSNSAAGLQSYRVSPKKGSVIYNAIDPERLKFIQPRPEKNNSPLVVVMSGRISPYKDFHTFFQAARYLSEQEPGQWRFIALGAGSEADRNNFKKQAGSLVENGVLDLPQAGLEVLPYLCQADIGVLLSAANFHEGVSNSIMEYMLCSLPVICSESGGNRELVINGVNGFVIPSENADQFIEKLKYLSGHPLERRQMGQTGCDMLNAKCKLANMVSEYESLYHQLLMKTIKTASARPGSSMENS